MEEAHSVSDVEYGQRLGAGWIVCRHTCAWQPPTDVYEDDHGIVVRIEVAGMRGEDFSVSLPSSTGGSVLIVEGRRTDPAPKRTYHQMEIPFGEFRAEVNLPWPVQAENVTAAYADGFLTVSLPCPPSRRSSSNVATPTET
jgi:HSP20 family molecular chaperone IbpA